MASKPDRFYCGSERDNREPRPDGGVSSQKGREGTTGSVLVLAPTAETFVLWMTRALRAGRDHPSRTRTCPIDLAVLTQVIWTLQNQADVAALVGDDHHRVLAWTEQTETRVSLLGRAGRF